ncbi:helix-turn-helix domain-containing protein [Terriglobus tenax]|uniref:helix-turn-helix domain-containing protein n=1 Tax=Terriglobus tenax TaxID=1111115 RepID=UPI0037D9F5BC
MSKLQTQLGARIRELRDSTGLSREEYSARVHLSARRIATLELGNGWPKADTLERIARSFNVQVRDLFDFSSSRLIPRKPL